jgi:hypothetical protein
MLICICRYCLLQDRFRYHGDYANVHIIITVSMFYYGRGREMQKRRRVEIERVHTTNKLRGP